MGDTITEITDSLTPVEKMLCETFSRVEIPGKRTVPVLLTFPIQSSIDLLIKFRIEAGVHASNPYLFARNKNDSLNPICRCDCL